MSKSAYMKNGNVENILLRRKQSFKAGLRGNATKIKVDPSVNYEFDSTYK